MTSGGAGPEGVTAIVLAGGAATRFGTDKLAAALRGAPVLHHALRAVSAAARDIVLVLAPDAPVPPLPADLADRVIVARDAEPHGGPLAGLSAGLAALADHPSLAHRLPSVALVVGGDMPDLVPDLLGLLVERLRELGGEAGDVVAITLAASPPSPLPLALRPEPALAAAAACLAEGRRSLHSLLSAVPSATVPEADWRAVDPAGRTLRDVDTPEDLQGR